MSILSNDKETPATLGQYKILTSSAAPPHGGSPASTFWVQQKSAGTQAQAQGVPPSIIAFMGDRSSLFRTNAAERYRALTSPNIMRLLEWGVVDWPDNRQLLAMIFQRPVGASLHSTFIANGTRMADTEIIGQVLPSLVKVIKEMAEHHLVHGAIRPSNIYMIPNGVVVLGECLTSPPASDQPISLLTIERGLTSPIGRGAGMTSDDIYALGATLVTLALGNDPLAELDPQAAVLQKIERGSVGAMVGRQHLSSSMMELARGLLDDNPAQRWSIETIEQWVNGRRTMPAQAIANKQLQRPLVVQGVELWDPRSVADAFSRNVPEAMRLIGNDELIKWVRRALRDIPLAERIADAVNMPLLTGKLGSHESRLVARVVMALHPSGPIRYQGHSLMPEAFGAVLSKILNAGESYQPLAELIVAQLPLYWYNIQADFHEDHVGPIKLFEHARVMMEQTAIGCGIERCHYELSPTSPYVAEGFEKLLILDSRQFLEGLELIAGLAQKPGQPVTRQAAAFLASRDGQLGNRIFQRLVKAQSESEKALGSLLILSTVQQHYNIAKLPNLCLWFDTLLQPAVDRLNNRQARETMRHDLRKAAGSGNLSLMLSTIENPAAYHWDREALAEAKRQYIYLDIEKSILNEELAPGSKIHRSVGREAATIVAGVLSVIVVVAMIVLQVGQS